MKVVILAGGLGTRISELTHSIPKPMVEIGGYPIIWHIMRYFSSFGHNDFIIALGYKGEVIKKYFRDYYLDNSNFTINLSDGNINYHSTSSLNWKVTLVDTGEKTMTGGRIKRLEEFLTEPFFLTYGDGLSDVDLNKLLEKHNTNRSLLTLTAIHPSSRYGKVEIGKDSRVEKFVEKPEFGGDWINGGYMVVEPDFIKTIDGDNCILEKEPLEYVAKNKKLTAYKHDGFWQCMDTLRDRNMLEDIWSSGKAKWKV